MTYALVDGRSAGDELGALMPKSVMRGVARLLREQGEARDRGVVLAPKLVLPGMVPQPPTPSAAADTAAQHAAATQRRVAEQIAILRNEANAESMGPAGFTGRRPSSFAAGLLRSKAFPFAAAAVVAVLLLNKKKGRR